MNKGSLPHAVRGAAPGLSTSATKTDPVKGRGRKGGMLTVTEQREGSRMYEDENEGG